MTRYLRFFQFCLFALMTFAANGDQSIFSESTVRPELALANDPACTTVLLPTPPTTPAASNATDYSIARYQKAATTAPRPLVALERLGWEFVAKARVTRDDGYYRLAELAANCLEATNPGTPEAILLRAHAWQNLHRFAEAEILARRLVEQRGLWSDFAVLGDVLIERGALDEAVGAYQQVIDQRPGPQAQVRVAHIRWLRGDLPGALEVLADALRSTSPRTPEAAAWALVRFASMLMSIDESAAAERALDRALTLQGDYPPALHLKGRVRLSQGRLPDAIALLSQAVAHDPLPEYRWTLYEALRSAGQHHAADEHKEELLRWGESEDPRTLALFLATYGEDPDTALRLALQELQQRADVFTLDAVAWASSVAGLPEQALGYSQRALDVGTRDARLFLHAGVIAARAGEHARATTLLTEADSMRATLLPSEQRRLAIELAALQSQTHGLVVETSRREDNLLF